MKTHWFDEDFLYDGSQLKSLFAYQKFGILGDSIVGWIGPCNITIHMIDAEDQRSGEKIEGSKMLHFIVEFFRSDLMTGVMLQRLLASIVLDELRNFSSDDSPDIFREGDDIFWNSGVKKLKLSISIATTSPISRLVHFAINISNLETPVPTCSLEDFNVNPVEFGKVILNKVALEFNSIVEATQKVHPVGSFQN